MAEGLRAEVLSYNDLRPIAEKFLSEYHPELTLPIPIEHIVDVRMGIDITINGFLQPVCGVDAFVNVGCTVIYVDSSVSMSANLNRYRFSLAHEVAHILLHKDILAAQRFTTLAEWKRVHDSMDPEQLAWLEWQAHALAGLILVPPKQLAKAFNESVAYWEGRGKTPRKTEPHRFLVEESLADEVFSVSREVIHRRCVYDRLWE